MAITGVNTYQDWSYTGGVQSFTAPYSGTYKLEVWGAQGGTADAAVWDETGSYKYAGGLGGYAYGTISLTKGQTVYICVGGMPDGSNNRAGGYNGGGNGAGGNSGGGGGATHIATANRTILSNYASYKSEVLIVAGGGGGAGALYSVGIGGVGGTGGGTSGGAGASHNGGDGPGKGGTQSAGGAGGMSSTNYEYVNSGFGQGMSITDTEDHGSAWTQNAGGGGGGYYGGGAAGYYCGGGGGSGYVGGVSSGSMQNGARSGSGFARITLTKLASQLYYNGTLVETLYFNGSLVDTVIYNGTTVMG